MISEEAIRMRSYYIWISDGCPEGKDLEHWQRAKRELESEGRSSVARTSDWKNDVMPCLRVMQPPSRLIAQRLGNFPAALLPATSPRPAQTAEAS